ncbi:heterodisulfide reductase-related iron-sulfur binding cluster [Boudabousia marimammalium]|uniref:heterodisulfide reductase-related iron-sulfur binding cluster n=1 Tax=Boudabousia marimammalium TaxID=156892 RepID=UPI00318390F5
MKILQRMQMGAPAPERVRPVGARLWRAFVSIFSHSGFRGRPVVRVAHWLVMVSFPLLFLTLITGYGQLLNPGFALPFLDSFAPYTWTVELIAWLSLLGILALMVVRLRNGGVLPWRKAEQLERGNQTGEASNLPRRFFGSTRWHAIFVELVVLGVVICVLVLRAAEYAYSQPALSPDHSALLLHPFTAWMGTLLTGYSQATLANLITVTACAKIVISMLWMMVVGVQTSMGVAWHRFLAVVNIYARREVDGSNALGPLEPIRVAGEPLTMETLEELPEDAKLGVGSISDFTWKGLLDFSTCTECGRCQELCPAWSTGKPLSPKLFTLALRDHHAATAAFMRAAQELEQPGESPAEDANGDFPSDLFTPIPEHSGDVLAALRASGAQSAEASANPLERQLVPEVITPDVLWACTTCGACVEQCPVDIEHVDHIVDVRRHQVLMESAFPKELAGVFKQLEKKGNPYGQAARKRMDWAKNLDFPVPVLGVDVEDATAVEYLFWVGCAGAFDDQGKKTSAAIAELLHRAGVSFAVLGQGESCTGDPARRAGNEVLYQMLAEAAVSTLNEVKARKIVVSCAHCFNTIAREFPDLDGHFEVVHHTQLLNRLVREKRLIPVPPQPGAEKTITYHDPCYLGRHNQIYEPPRELLDAIPGVKQVEMPRSREGAMCCGGGGARAWMEESEGTRIAVARMGEAAGTGAAEVATACPFCTQMLGSAGQIPKQSGAGETDSSVQVHDISLTLLEAVRRGDQPDLASASVGGSNE